VKWCVYWKNISIAVRTSIIGLLNISPHSCSILQLHLQRWQAKVVSNVLLILLCCSLKIESTQFSQKMCGAPTPKPLQGRCTLSEPFCMDHPRITEPGSATDDCDHVFSNKSSKRFIGDILHIVILQFRTDILTLSVKICVPVWSKRNYCQLALT